MLQLPFRQARAVCWVSMARGLVEAHCQKPGEAAQSVGLSRSGSRSRSGCTLDRLDKAYLNANLILEASDVKLSYFNLQLSELWKESNK